MQIIIELSDEKYKDIQARDWKNTIWADEVTTAIQNGIVLPKHHGRLIDADNLLDRIGLEDNDSNREDNVGEIVTLEDFDFIPTIIEADNYGGRL